MMKNIPDIVIKKKIDTWNIIVNNVKKIYISFYNKIILFFNKLYIFRRIEIECRNKIQIQTFIIEL